MAALGKDAKDAEGRKLHCTDPSRVAAVQRVSLGSVVGFRDLTGSSHSYWMLPEIPLDYRSVDLALHESAGVINTIQGIIVAGHRTQRAVSAKWARVAGFLAVNG